MKILSERSSYCGAVYLSWNDNDHWLSGVNDNSIQKQWFKFVEREAGKVSELSASPYRLKWMNNDLFILVKLAHEGQQTEEIMEERLIDQFGSLKSQWEEAFRIEIGGSMTGVVWTQKLHFGVGVMGRGESAGEMHLWYEVCKRAMLQGQSYNWLENRLMRKTLHELLSQDRIFPVYQPIISLEDYSLFGYEALTRMKEQNWFKGPQQLFDFAESVGEVYALDRHTREKAINGCIRLEGEQRLFINVMAQILKAPDFSPGQTKDLLQQHRLTPNNVVFEITERSTIEDFTIMKKALEHYRNQGYQIAIDDVGAGYSSLQSVVELRPDYLKVDRSIISNIHRDEMKNYILHTLMELSVKLDIPLIAEGIEHEEVLVKLKAMGVHYAQGYLIGRPAPFPS